MKFRKKAASENQLALDELTRRLNAYCFEQGLPHDSADELAFRESTTLEQREWLMAFIDEWEAIV